MATLSASALRERRPTLVTFGSPRVGDAEFARPFRDIPGARVVNCCDVVARIPPEEFDQAHIKRLLTELAGEQTLAEVVAQAISLLFLLKKPHFVDVRAPHYVTAAGPIIENPPVANIRADQADARARYRSAPRANSARQGSHAQPAAIDIAGVRQLLRERAGDLFTASGPKLPIRDLADHAPINYLSAVVRHFRGQ